MNFIEARRIAGDWHDGQSSALYALASTGTILPGYQLAAELRRCLAEVKAHIGHYTEQDIRELHALVDFFGSTR